MKNDPVLLSETQDYICPFRLAITAQRCFQRSKMGKSIIIYGMVVVGGYSNA